MTAPQQLQSYRGLIEALHVAEGVADKCEAEEKYASTEAKELRIAVRAEEVMAEKLAPEVAKHVKLSKAFREQSAELWIAHRSPLHEQQESTAAAVRMAQAQTRANSIQERYCADVHTECFELRQLETTLRDEIAAKESECHTLKDSERNARQKGASLRSHISASEEKVNFLGEHHETHTSIRARVESEAIVEQRELEESRREIVEADHLHRGILTAHQTEQRACHHDLSLHRRDIHHVLQKEENLADETISEIRACRERALRHEATLASLCGDDVASNMKRLNASRLRFSQTAGSFKK